MSEPPKVALLFHYPCKVAPAILAGISRYVRPHGRWSVFVDTGWPTSGQSPPWLESCQWEGLLICPSNAEVKHLLRSKGIPVVQLNDSHDDCDFPSVGTDHAAVGTMGAVHLLERGFRNFAFCGFAEHDWSVRRQNGFRAAIEEKGFSVSIHDWPPGGKLAEAFTQVSEWLKSLPKPVAIMTCTDQLGLQIINACRHIGCSIPNDIGVLGVDNDESVCAVSNPALSSVSINSERIGYEAAKLLDALMENKSPEQTKIRIGPLGITTRQSTDIVATNNWMVAEATRFIRKNAFRGCKVSDVLRHLQVSTTTLETHFQEVLNRSPRDEIHRIQLNELKDLLRTTKFTLSHIAELTGFDHPEYVSVFFKRETGQTPGDYRKQFQQYDAR